MEPGRWGMGRGILCSLVGSFRFLVSLWGYAAASSVDCDDGGTESDEELESEGCISSQREAGE